MNDILFEVETKDYALILNRNNIFVERSKDKTKTIEFSKIMGVIKPLKITRATYIDIKNKKFTQVPYYFWGADKNGKYLCFYPNKKIKQLPELINSLKKINPDFEIDNDIRYNINVIQEKAIYGNLDTNSYIKIIGILLFIVMILVKLLS